MPRNLSSTLCFLAILLVFCVALSFEEVPNKKDSATAKVIYGEDGRKDEFQVPSDQQILGNATALIVVGNNVMTPSGQGYSRVRTQTALQFWNFCPTERYSDQPIFTNGMAFCSGFLISSDPPILATAAHCTGHVLTSYTIVFGFQYNTANGSPTIYSDDEVYKVKSILVSGTPSGGVNDFGALLLDRPVVGRIPYTTSAQVNIGDPLTLIGYPMGLPKKYDYGGAVTTVSDSLITATTDSYGGNSGSPVFNSNTGKLIGILVGGAPDFIQQEDGCLISNVCPQGQGCSVGEEIVPICVFFDNSVISSYVHNPCNDATVDTATNSEPASSNNNNEPSESDDSTQTASASSLHVSLALFISFVGFMLFF